MNLSSEDRKIIVELELEKAERILAEYDVLFQAGLWNTLANRLYYAVFHAVSALLVHDEREVGTHKGASIRFQQYYVKTKMFTIEEARFYSRLQTMRESADYNCTFDLSKEEVVNLIEPSRMFIQKIKEYINTETPKEE